jgi:hypothetical protein
MMVMVMMMVIGIIVVVVVVVMVVVAQDYSGFSQCLHGPCFCVRSFMNLSGKM